MKKMFLVFMIANSLVGKSYSQESHDHLEHAPGHCEWCDRNRERGIKMPENQPRLNSSSLIEEVRQSSPLSLIFLALAGGATCLAIGIRVVLNRKDSESEE